MARFHSYGAMIIGMLAWACVWPALPGPNNARAASAQEAPRPSVSRGPAPVHKRGSKQTMWVYVGTYTNGQSKGIYVCRFDAAEGTIEATGVTAPVKSPSFLAIHPNRRFLYAVSEIHEKKGRESGGVTALEIDEATGKLKVLNQQPSGGRGPCHLSVDATGKVVLVANYSSGIVAMLPIEPDGSLAPPSDVVQHAGSSVNPKRQQGPRAHSILPDPPNRCAFAADLGIDKLMAYRLDLKGGKLTPNDPPFAKIHAGAGPRHFAFHPTRDFIYVINELDSTMSILSYDRSTGAVKEITHLSTLPDGWEGENYCADVHVHPNGKFLYGSNRGHDSIVIYEITPSGGSLTCKGHESVRGEWPRNFALDPEGKFLIAANQNTNNLVVFRIDPSTGLLSATGSELKIPKPVCVKFLVR